MFSSPTHLLATAVALIVAGLEPTPSVRDAADLVVIDGVVYTVDSTTPEVEAFAVRDGAIVALGDSRTILEEHRGPLTRVLDLQGRTVIPGLIDAHAHVMGLGRALRSIDLVGTTRPEEIALKVSAAVKGRPAGSWITGRGWDQNDWPEKEFPTHDVLDRAAPDHPVWLTRVDGHAGWANARAMELAGVTLETPDPDGGRIVRDATGHPSGVFVDNAQGLIARAIPVPDDAERESRLAAAQSRILEVGLTGVHDMGVNRPELELYRRWADEGRLEFRVAAYLGSDRETLDWWEGGAWEGPAAAHPRLRVPGVKLYADGALGSRGAALLEPYSDDAGNRGLLVTPPDTLRDLVARALSLGLQTAIHAIGDRGNRVALDAIEASVAPVTADLHCTVSPTADGGGSAVCGTAASVEQSDSRDAVPARPRIEHAQVVALEDIPRFAELGIVASVQPTHATSDMYWAEERVDPERIRGAYAWRKLREAGALLACGSDFPVENPNPFHGLYAAVTRRDQEGWPEGGWYPEERMTREEALACFTIDAARAASTDDRVGSLAVGKRADFLVLDRDYFEIPDDEIWRIRVLRTVVDGETVYEAPASNAVP
ncbi:MAG: amidohydrolase [Gemmatimonadota bacterium]